MEKKLNNPVDLPKPDYLFEVSWEICNKVGGIHTVIATKALSVLEAVGPERYILIGPDVSREEANPEFEEDTELLKAWRQHVYNEGIRIKVGRWKIKGSPLAVLVDFSSFFATKDDVLKFMWETYRVDSISGQWDYIEPVLFGYAAGKVIESYIETFCSSTDRVVAHFHEWMTGSGGLYLQKYSPYMATVFTTHATILGRTLAGNGQPLYSNLPRFIPDDSARKYNIVAKHSLEKTAAAEFDCFATVSDITARECKYLLSKEVDIVTPNGFEDDIVWKGAELEAKRKESRGLMIRVAEACLGIKYEKDPLIVGTSGRYEFKNKGIDVLLESLKKVAADAGDRPVLAYITVPAGNNGPRRDLQAHLRDGSPIDTSLYKHTTHYLAGWDPIVEAMKGSVLTHADSSVQVIFVPSYLNGDDGIFNLPYYDLLAGMDITVFASYYEPWGYTPLESVAFSVPTVTTSLAGFGLWVDRHNAGHEGIDVIERTDDNDGYVIDQIAEEIKRYAAMDAKAYTKARASALEISKTALWKNLVEYYWQAYNKAIDNSVSRTNKVKYEGGGAHYEQINFVRQQLVSNTPTWTRIMIEKSLPDRLHPLEVLSRNLWWSWTSGAHELFEYADPQLWAESERNPIVLLDRLSLGRIRELEADKEFLAKMDAVYEIFNAYMAEKKTAKGPKIAYFSMEYGLHSSLKIYSGGLGILAGDYLKEASDKNVPMVAMGLLYRYGYFTQKLSAQGEQEAGYEPQNFAKLPITPVRDEEGNWSTVFLAFPGRTVTARIWKCEVGRTDLYLLDTDHDLNLDEDRTITHHLYGGDWENRLKQELLLGIGGIRALNTMGIKQDVYHCNEGHAALIGIERIRNLVNKTKLSFSEALEVVRSSSLFTTHTPVPAGHDAFPESMIRQYMSHYPDRLNITWDQFINLGRVNPNDPNEKFSMSYLASNLSQEVNGVSWLHGEVSKDILGGMWPGYFKDELHIGYVTNGVHFPTWTAPNLRKLYLRYFPEGFTQKDYDIPAWQKVHDIADDELWKERMFLKEKLIRHIRRCLTDPQQMLFASPEQIVRIIDSLRPDVLTIGFARRFATYKRAHLLFTNLQRLEQIVNNPERPVQFVFAGKAHPNDKPGQDLIKRIVEVSAMPQFAGKVIFLQNYDMDTARKMVQGVDIWLNTPTRPLEASGTSGEKAVMNGVMQFSVLDGWWVEGYKEGAGWMLPMERTYTDQNFQNQLDAEMIYTTIEEQIVPMYYNRTFDNVPHQWIQSMKNCISDIASNFTTNRMLRDYEERFYGKLYEHNRLVTANDFTLAREIAAWKRKVSNAWDKVRVVSVNQSDMGKAAVMLDSPYTVEVVVDIDGLRPEDIGVELVMAKQINDASDVQVSERHPLKFVGQNGSNATYNLEMMPSGTGTFDLAVRVYPKNDKLPHRMDFALVKWA
ncbi:MAG: alpha-glucan family phosphorylase [Rikenellaceae bacterium]|nr:alpha-glucan family phosphorylase [Rikenellaceae bacterium]